MISSELDTVTVLVPDSVDLASIIPEITISEKATIEPSSGEAVDFSQGDVTYTVTAEDNTTKEWYVSVTYKLSSEAEILSFRFAMFQVGDAIFDGQNIYVEVYYGVNLAALNPIIEISENASISPESNITTDFSSGSVVYTVTAQDGTEKIWTVYVSYTLNYQAEIISFTIPGQVGETRISGQSIQVDVAYGTDVSALTPSIEISYGATISPASGETVDFSETGSVEYTVTSENGVNIKTWTARIHFPITPADDPNFRYIGRWDFSNPSLPRV